MYTLVDFDMFYGHRRNVRSYTEALEAFVEMLPDKPYEWTMVRIDACCEVFCPGKLAGCVYCKTHFQRLVPILAKKSDIKNLLILFKEKFWLEATQSICLWLLWKPGALTRPQLLK